MKRRSPRYFRLLSSHATLEEATKQPGGHVEKLKNSEDSWRLATDYGHAVVINIMPNKILIYWREVSLTAGGAGG